MSRALAECLQALAIVFENIHTRLGEHLRAGSLVRAGSGKRHRGGTHKQIRMSSDQLSHADHELLETLAKDGRIEK